jgi:hypothetical protein
MTIPREATQKAGTQTTHSSKQVALVSKYQAHVAITSHALSNHGTASFRVLALANALQAILQEQPQLVTSAVHTLCTLQHDLTHSSAAGALLLASVTASRRAAG